MINITLICLLSIAAVELLIILGVSENVVSITVCSFASMKTLLSQDICDDEKEAATRRAAKIVSILTLKLCTKLVAVGVLLYVFFRVFNAAFPGFSQYVSRNLLSPLLLITMALLMLCYVRIRNMICNVI